jgi:hypothetical protein
VTRPKGNLMSNSPIIKKVKTISKIKVSDYRIIKAIVRLGRKREIR